MAKIHPDFGRPGFKAGRLTLVGLGGKTKRGHTLWTCLCSCGNTVEVEFSDLTSGKTTSCGCRKAEILKYGSIKHGHSRSGDPTMRAMYATWTSMRSRCYCLTSKAYPDYGGRGIVMSDAWRDSFLTFVVDMGVKEFPWMSVDRVDVNGPYSKENCRWVDLKEQNGNKRNTVWVTVDGERQCLKHACQRLGLSYTKIYKRMRTKAISFEEAIAW